MKKIVFAMEFTIFKGQYGVLSLNTLSYYLLEMFTMLISNPVLFQNQEVLLLNTNFFHTPSIRIRHRRYLRPLRLLLKEHHMLFQS